MMASMTVMHAKNHLQSHTSSPDTYKRCIKKTIYIRVKHVAEVLAHMSGFNPICSHIRERDHSNVINAPNHTQHRPFWQSIKEIRIQEYSKVMKS